MPTAIFLLNELRCIGKVHSLLNFTQRKEAADDISKAIGTATEALPSFASKGTHPILLRDLFALPDSFPGIKRLALQYSICLTLT